MKILSFLLGILFDEAADFVSGKTMSFRRSIRSTLKKVHKYIISCFILSFVGTLSLTALIVKLGVNLDSGVFWTPSLTLFSVIVILSYGILGLIINKKDIQEYYETHDENSDDMKDILDQIIKSQSATPKRRSPKKRRPK